MITGSLVLTGDQHLHISKLNLPNILSVSISRHLASVPSSGSQAPAGVAAFEILSLSREQAFANPLVDPGAFGTLGVFISQLLFPYPIYSLELSRGTACHLICDKQNP